MVLLRDVVIYGLGVLATQFTFFLAIRDADAATAAIMVITGPLFVIGWIAKTYPDIVRQIASKYQVGSHTMNHQLVWQQSREAFKEDVSSSIKLLEDITGQKVEAFRAPGFSIRESEGWAIEILHELGIRMDSSVFPAHHAHGGMPSYVSAVLAGWNITE